MMKCNMATSLKGYYHNFANFMIVTCMFARFSFALTTANTSTAAYTYQLMKITNHINQTIVIKTYTRIGSIQHCGMKCTNQATQSFAFDEDSSSCYCNREAYSDLLINVTANVSATVTYGRLVATQNVMTNDSTALPQNVPRSGNVSECQDLYDLGNRVNGEYLYNSTGEKICNMTSLGWLVFQRRYDGSVDFYRNWTEYASGFGDPNGEFWLGLETLHLMTIPVCELHIYMEAETNNTIQSNGYARYSTFYVDEPSRNFKIYVLGFTGNVGDGLSGHSSKRFSTYDQGSYSCAQSRAAGWWFNACGYSNLNGLYLTGKTWPRLDGIVWQLPWGQYYSLLATEMAYRC